ncbi:hypothetical protein CR513_23013, partial [Mucuna pruriens]
MDGSKRSAEAVECKNELVGKRFALEGRTHMSNGGRGGITQTLLRIQCLENPRVPPQGSSTKGESRPKIKLKDVVDGHHMNTHVPSFVGPEGRRRL